MSLVSEVEHSGYSYQSFVTNPASSKGSPSDDIISNRFQLKISWNCSKQFPVISIFVSYTFLIFLFAFMGGILFHICEYESENIQILRKQDLYQQISTALKEMDASYPIKLDKLLNMCDIPLHLEDNRWSLNKSVFFAFTTASTIGYGFTTPITFWGRASTFIYGFPAIMIFGLAMIQIGHAIVNRIDTGALCVCCRNCSVELQRTVCICLLLSLLIALSAWAMTTVEEQWSFIDGCYFMWISISTIGYGDLEPTVIQSSYWANVLVWLGLSLTAILIGSSQDYFQVKMKRWRSERITQKQTEQSSVMLHIIHRDSA